MRHLPRHRPHGTAGPNTGWNVRLSNRYSLESTDTFAETNNQTAWRTLAKWLKHSRKYSNKTVCMKRLVWPAMRDSLNKHLPETPGMCLRTFINITMYPAIHSYDELAFNNMSEESENNNFIVKKSLWPDPSQGMVEQANKHGGFRPQRGYPGNAFRPQTARWPRIAWWRI